MRLIMCIALALSSFTLMAQEDSIVVSPNEEYAEPQEGEDTQTGSVSHTLIEPEALPKTEEYKSQKLAIRKFDKKKWREIIGTTSYNEKARKEPEKKLEIPRVPIAGNVIKIIFYAIILAVFAWIIYLAVKNASSLDYRLKKTKLEGEDIAKPIEDIETLDVEALLRETLAAGNFKLAVRLYYLGLLKKLNEGGIILWKKDKTNHDYLAELFSKNFFFDEIKILTRVYEEVWYGDHGITRESFEMLSSNFENIQQQINASRQS